MEYTDISFQNQALSDSVVYFKTIHFTSWLIKIVYPHVISIEIWRVLPKKKNSTFPFILQYQDEKKSQTEKNEYNIRDKSLSFSFSFMIDMWVQCSSLKPFRRFLCCIRPFCGVDNYRKTAMDTTYHLSFCNRV